MRRYLPYIAVVWGAVVILYGISTGISGGAYGAGQAVALFFGVALVVAGVRELRKRAAAT